MWIDLLQLKPRGHVTQTEGGGVWRAHAHWTDRYANFVDIPQRSFENKPEGARAAGPGERGRSRGRSLAELGAAEPGRGLMDNTRDLVSAAPTRAMGGGD